MDSDLTLDFIIIVILIIANGLFFYDRASYRQCQKRRLERDGRSR